MIGTERPAAAPGWPGPIRRPRRRGRRRGRPRRVIAALECIGVVETEHDLPPLERGPEELDGLGGTADLEVVRGEVIAAPERIGVVRTERGPPPL